MTTDQMYDVLDSLPKGSGRCRVFFSVADSGMGAASYELGVCYSADERYFCITSDDCGDMFHSVDELKFRLSYLRNSKVLFVDDRYWETPHAAECYEIVECDFERPFDVNGNDNMRPVRCLLRVKRVEFGATDGKIHWFEDCYGDEVDLAVAMKQSKIMFCNSESDGEVEESTDMKDAPDVSVSQIEVVCGKVEDIVADAVVNAANEHLAAGSGICGAIFRKAGYAPLQAACDKVAPCPTGEARITPAFGIANAKYVIHAVGPRWYGSGKGEPALLANCYRNLLKTAVDNGCRSVAIPSISTGIFGYPLDAAIAIAVREVKAFVAAHAGFKVIFVVWDGDADGGMSTKAKYLKALG